MSNYKTSWGNYPAYPQSAHPAHWQNDLVPLLTKLTGTYQTTLPFGNGRSYGDSCLAASDHVLDCSRLNRFISADWDAGIIRAEAGILLSDILQLAIPQGWFLPITPGTQYITLGGAIANDVHGKNHHKRGTFGRYIKEFGLLRSDQSTAISCSLTENPKLFTATIGGLGLTGLITWAELQLIPIQSSLIEATSIRFSSLKEFFSLSDELDTNYEYSVAWIDCLAQGAASGRGIYTVGHHASSGPLKIDKKRKFTVPFTFPISAFHPLSLRALNSSYYRKHKTERQKYLISYEPFFYPLDRILKWNRIYGPKGFQQYQCVIPNKNAQSAIQELLNIIARFGSGSFLAVLKKCGDISSPGLLSFPLPGVSLALDFPQKEYLNTQLFPSLDKIVYQAEGRLYPAKDAHMSGEYFRHFYPNWNQLEQLRDPKLCSRFWRRVTQS